MIIYQFNPNPTGPLLWKEKTLKKWQIVINDFASACRFTPGQKMTETVEFKEGTWPFALTRPVRFFLDNFSKVFTGYGLAAIICASIS